MNHTSGRAKTAANIPSISIPYKWEDYRIEIEEPDTDDENERKAYYDAALAAFKLYTDAYLISLARLEAEDDQALIDGIKEGTERGDGDSCLRKTLLPARPAPFWRPGGV